MTRHIKSEIFSGKLLALSGLLLVAACTPDMSPQEHSPAVQDEQTINYEDYSDSIARALDAERVPGAAIAVLKSCSVAFTGVYGIRDARTSEPVTADTRFEVASLSKPVFSYLVLQLVDEGVFGLDEPVSHSMTYPRIADSTAYSALTPRLLLSHQSGLPNWAGNALDPMREDVLEIKSSPGAQFSYSGEGYWLLQAYVEHQTGLGLEALFQERLGAVMPQATYGSLPEGTMDIAYGHGPAGDQAGGRKILGAVAPNAAYSLRATISDYASFLEMVCAGDGLSDELRAEMLLDGVDVTDTPFAEQSDEVPLAWALGWGVQKGPRRIHFHWGDNDQFKAFVALDAETGDGVVFLSNGQNGLGLIPTIIEPVVGPLDDVTDWLQSR